MSLTHPQYRADINGLRAIAVLSVVIFHAFPSAIRGGFVGVDIFFVISGFLISTIIFRSLEREVFSFREFYGRRIRRIFPALLLVLTTSFALGWVALLADEFKQLGAHIAAGAGFVSNLVLWTESGYFDTAAETKPLLHLWSLGVEEQFYIVWPLLLWLAWKRRLSLVVLTAVIALLSFAANVGSVREDPVATFFLPHTRFWELLAGALLAGWRGWSDGSGGAELVTLARRRLRTALSVVGVVLLLTAIFSTSRKYAFPGWWALAPVLGTVMVIAAGAHAWANRVILSSRLLVWFGLISYPLYLWHWPLLSLARIVEGELPSLKTRLIVVGLSVLLAWLTYEFVEGPVRREKTGKYTTRLVSLMALCLCVGYVTFLQDGLRFRKAVTAYPAAKLETEGAATTDNACLSYLGGNPTSLPFCRLNAIGSKETLAIIGDSHAHAAYPGMVNVAATAGMNTLLLGNSGCPPLIDGAYGDTPEKKKKCRERIESIVNTVAHDVSIRKVVIFTRGMVYLTGHYYGEASGSDFPYIPIAPALFESSLQNTIDQLQHQGKTVYYVSENPEMSRLPRHCIERPLRNRVASCTPTRAEVESRQADYRALLLRLKRVHLIDTLEDFCPGDQCATVDQGTFLYADFDHLSPTGSQFQARLIAPRIGLGLPGPEAVRP